ncbi:MAG: hypothetical protein ACJ70X_07500 [Nitrososphaera sp.]
MRQSLPRSCLLIKFGFKFAERWKRLGDEDKATTTDTTGKA